MISLDGIDDATIGIKLRNRQGGDNEYDVMFTRGNKLYFVECKSLDQNDDKKTEALYKIGALQKEFGLRAESFLLTTSPHVLGKDGKLKETVRARAEQFNTTVLIGSNVAVVDFSRADRRSSPQPRRSTMIVYVTMSENDDDEDHKRQSTALKFSVVRFGPCIVFGTTKKL